MSAIIALCISSCVLMIFSFIVDPVPHSRRLLKYGEIYETDPTFREDKKDKMLSSFQVSSFALSIVCLILAVIIDVVI